MNSIHAPLTAAVVLATIVASLIVEVLKYAGYL